MTSLSWLSLLKSVNGEGKLNWRIADFVWRVQIREERRRTPKRREPNRFLDDRIVICKARVRCKQKQLNFPSVTCVWHWRSRRGRTTPRSPPEIGSSALSLHRQHKEKIISITDKDKSDFFKKGLQQFVNFLKGGFIFTGITQWGQFYFVKCSQIKLFSNFYFVTKSSWENCL